MRNQSRMCMKNDLNELEICYEKKSETIISPIAKFVLIVNDANHYTSTAVRFNFNCKPTEIHRQIRSRSDSVPSSTVSYQLFL